MCPTGGVHHSRPRVLPRLLTFLLLLVTTAPSTRSAPLGVTRLEGVTRLVATPLALDPAKPARRRFGALTFLAGWHLTSADARLGGISALGVEPGGLLALSDSGTVMHIGLADGRPATLRLHGLPDGPGDSARKSDRDTEALATDPATGRHWIAYEHHHQVWRYDARFSRSETHAPIAQGRRWGSNAGAEAMVRLPDGRTIIISEGRRGPGGTADLLVVAGDPAMPGSPSWRRRYAPPGTYRVTDAAMLGRDRLLVLHRLFSLADGVGALLGVVDLSSLNGDAVIRPRVLAEWGPQFAIDNMEGLAVSAEGGRTIVWMASDDNFNPVQRTLLLKFAL